MVDEPNPCGCAICALKINFAIDQHLLSEIEKQNCVIFAGAGISTETGGTHPNTLYETIKFQVGADGNPEFCELVDKYEAQPNGRQKFIELVRERFSYIDSFRDLRWSATRFHRTLGNAPYFKTIITTNWDRYFENLIEAIPFVYDSDIPFWDTAKRSVIKIHGSIDNFSSIVASSEDYDQCERRLREGALGAVVKQIFATKTCVFCGYSAKDSDFRRIFKTIREGLGQFARVHYLISPFISMEEADNLRDEFGIIAIKTDAAHFVDTIKDHMSEKFCFAKDEVFEKIDEIWNEFHDMHLDFVKSYHPKKQPHLIFATAYQDGVLHALERILDRSMTGEFSDLHNVQRRIAGYDLKIAEYRKAKNYWDIAYFSGYQNGLLQFAILNSDNVEVVPIPECFHPGQGELYLDEFNEIVRPTPAIHKAALREAKKRTASFAEDEDLVVQHLAWG